MIMKTNYYSLASRVIMLVLACMLTFGLASCSSDDEPSNTDRIAGIWYGIVREDGRNYIAKVIFHTDGSGSYTVEGRHTAGMKWQFSSSEGIQYTLLYSGGSDLTQRGVWTYRFEGDKLILSGVVFTREKPTLPE